MTMTLTYDVRKNACKTMFLIFLVYLIVWSGHRHIAKGQQPVSTEDEIFECSATEREVVDKIWTIIFCNLNCPSNNSCSLGDGTLSAMSPDGAVLTVYKIACPATNISIPVYLGLSGKRINRVEQDAFSSFRNHVSLAINLAGNEIQLKAGAFINLHNLDFMDLAYNKIENIACNAFSNLTHLTKLLLNNNVIRTLQKCSFRGIQALEVLNLQINSLETIENGTFQDVPGLKDLSIDYNRIKDVDCGAFSNLAVLVNLSLGGNELTQLKGCSLSGLIALETLSIPSNSLEYLDIGLFRKSTALLYLYLGSNHIKVLQNETFQGLIQLKVLSIPNNLIEKLETGTFHEMRNLRVLHLANNLLVEVPSRVFLHQTQLEVLQLDNNQFKYLSPLSFYGLNNLRVLDLSGNDLHSVPLGLLDNIIQVRILKMANNTIEKLHKEMFSHLDNLDTLDLRGNSLKWVSRKTFTGLRNTTKVLVQNHAICCYIDAGICLPTEPRSPFVSCQRLLPRSILRGTMWVIGIASILANGVVVIWRMKRLRFTDNKVQSLLIINLSSSDLLMGIYMLTITSADIYFSDNFPSNSDNWREGYVCKIAGAVAMLSSEASVFFITLISIDRFLGVLFPFSQHRLTTKKTRIAAVIIWIFALSLSIISEILSAMKSAYYDISEVCIGLPMTRREIISYTSKNVSVSLLYTDIIKIVIPSTAEVVTGMYFSIAVYIGINFICFLVIACCYLAIFITVLRSARQSGRTRNVDEQVRLAAKMSLIVMTDFFCWMPVIITCILVQTGQLTVSPTVYAWTVAFILPINSSVNPFLYTLSRLRTRKARKERSRSTAMTALKVIQTSTNSEAN